MTAQLRPTFSIPTRMEAAEVFKRIRAAIEEGASEIDGQFTSSNAMISIAPSKRHFWSPWLQLEVRELETGNDIFGQFSPHPSIWTGFMLAYLAIVVLSFFSLVFGFSQLLVAQSPWAFWLILIWVFVGIALWIASQTGQKLALNEMLELKSVVEKSIVN